MISMEKGVRQMADMGGRKEGGGEDVLSVRGSL
jgi:hypothetical protein